MGSEYDELGLEFQSGDVRVARLAESVSIIKALLEGEEVTHAGEHYRLSGHRIFPAPGRPRVPLLIGGNSRRVLTLAAREADIIGFVGFSHRARGTAFDLTAFTDAGTAEKIDLVRQEAGARFADLELNALVQQVGSARSWRREAEETAREYGLELDAVLASPYLLFGSATAMADSLRERRERHGFSYWVVFEPFIEKMAPVVAQLAGT
jgi:probable F420-dependent oxidoreductase